MTSQVLSTQTGVEPRTPVSKGSHGAIGLVVFIALLLVPAPISCGMLVSTETREETLTVGDAPTLVVRAQNGSVELRSMAGDTVEVEATLRDPSRVQYEVSQVGNTISVIADVEQGGWDFFRGSAGADIVVTAPPGTVLDIETSNGRIEAVGFRESAVLTTSNGRVVLEEVRGDYEIRTRNGSIEVNSLEGSLTARASNGSLDLSGLLGQVDAETSNGRIDFEGEFAPETVNRLWTSNGNVAVRIEGETGVELEATTSNGRVDIGLHIEATLIEETRVEGIIGDGSAGLLVRTSNGSITVD